MFSFCSNFASVTYHSRYTSKLTGDRRQQRILTYPAALFAKLHTQTDGEVDGHVAPATRLHHSHYHRPLTLLPSLEIYLPHLTARSSHPFWKHTTRQCDNFIPKQNQILVVFSASQYADTCQMNFLTVQNGDGSKCSRQFWLWKGQKEDYDTRQSWRDGERKRQEGNVPEGFQGHLEVTWVVSQATT